ncbi:PREDICTED: MATH and LRR domain-containing protein PFE0570w-like [Acropora digitifera]|uniref:MATH and LRR domain-containing protein PFE0570w-like n=1 Tax=Acropora digitifera TaxID=70779 RepID=UPI00077A73CB|nr:PREDICTED: MATH and LRR domain-containing protein PFE0570w-like [Acropora digitifera]
MVTTSSYSFQVMISNYLLGFLSCSLFKLSHPRLKLQSCIMAANVYTILIQEPVEKKRKRGNEAQQVVAKQRQDEDDDEDMEVENVAVGVSDDDDDCDDDDDDYLYGHMSTEEAKASIKDKLLSLIQGPDLFSEIHCFGGIHYNLQNFCIGSYFTALGLTRKICFQVSWEFNRSPL